MKYIAMQGIKKFTDLLFLFKILCLLWVFNCQYKWFVLNIHISVLTWSIVGFHKLLLHNFYEFFIVIIVRYDVGIEVDFDARRKFYSQKERVLHFMADIWSWKEVT